ncbi:nucleotidyltransferase family protein [Minwuia sp.]|uniref:nucleotidyltransferase family protein n=1 Tax=Minwuia sp. TaxID=2493630 RepID=UPI003A8FF2ED
MTEADIAMLLAGRDDLRALLETVRDLDLPDCWIGAGMVRNAVWDHLHGVDPATRPASDVDVVYFDPADTDPARDAELEATLKTVDGNIDWEVRNQARMHLRNGDRPYRDTEDALRFWPETATAVAARLNGDRVQIIAPYGTSDLLGLIVRPTPPFRRKMDIFNARQAAKGWAQRWPKLTFAAI